MLKTAKPCIPNCKIASGNNKKPTLKQLKN